MNKDMMKKISGKIAHLAFLGLSTWIAGFMYERGRLRGTADKRLSPANMAKDFGMQSVELWKLIRQRVHENNGKKT